MYPRTMPAPMAMIITIMISPSTYPVKRERKETKLETEDPAIALSHNKSVLPELEEWIHHMILGLYLVSLSPSFLWSSSALSD